MANVDIRTNRERPVLTIDGTEYHLNTRADLRYKSIAFMGYAGQRLATLSEDLQSPENYTDEKGEEFESLLQRASYLVLHDVPEEVFVMLSDEDRMRVVQAFSEAVDLPQQEVSRPDTSEQ